MSNKKKFPLIIFLVFLAFLTLFAGKVYAFFSMQNGYFQGNQGKGWFWYKHKPRKAKSLKKNLQKLDLPAIKKMDVKQLKVLLKKELNTAVSNPTECNVKRWLEVKNIAV